MSKRRILVSLEERNMLLKSKVIEGYPKLAGFLSTRDWRVERNEMNKLNSEIANLFLHDIYTDLVVAATSEWRHNPNIPVVDIDDAPEKKLVCELCNTSTCKSLYTIENVQNRNSMRIGSACISRFGSEEARAIKESIKAQMRLHRLEKLNEVFPGILNEYKENEANLDFWPFLIPDPLFKQYRDSILTLRHMANEYDAELTDEETKVFFDQVSMTIGNMMAFKAGIIQWTERQSGAPLSIPRATAQYIAQHKGANTVQQLRKKGAQITSENFHLMADMSIVQERWLPRISAQVPQDKVRDVQFGEYNGEHGYSYSLVREKKIRLFLPHPRIAQPMAESILGGMEIYATELFRDSVVFREEDFVRLISAVSARVAHKYLGYSDDRDELYISRDGLYYIEKLRYYVTHNLEPILFSIHLMRATRQKEMRFFSAPMREEEYRHEIGMRKESGGGYKFISFGNS